MAKKAFAVAVVAVICLVLAQPKANFSDRPGPKILTEKIDLVTNKITITGVDFGSSTPVVFLAGNQLIVESFNSATQTIVAFLPGVLSPGNYRLEVLDDHGRQDSFVATILP